jgi:hypothetical protein
VVDPARILREQMLVATELRQTSTRLIGQSKETMVVSRQLIEAARAARLARTSAKAERPGSEADGHRPGGGAGRAGGR